MSLCSVIAALMIGFLATESMKMYFSVQVSLLIKTVAFWVIKPCSFLFQSRSSTLVTTYEARRCHTKQMTTVLRNSYLICTIFIDIINAFCRPTFTVDCTYQKSVFIKWTRRYLKNIQRMRLVPFCSADYGAPFCCCGEPQAVMSSHSSSSSECSWNSVKINGVVV